MESCLYFIQVMKYQFRKLFVPFLAIILDHIQNFNASDLIFTEKEQHAKQLDAFYTGFAGLQNNITDGQCMVFANVRSEDSRDRRAYTKLCKLKYFYSKLQNEKI